MMLKEEESLLNVRNNRKERNPFLLLKQIDTLAAEYPAQTNSFHLTYQGTANDVKYVGDKRSIIVLGFRSLSDRVVLSSLIGVV